MFHHTRSSPSAPWDVTGLGTELDVGADRVLVHEGDFGRQFCVILDGEAIVTAAGDPINRLGPGSFFGEIALLNRGCSTATVRSLTAMRLVVLDPREFADLLDRCPRARDQLATVMAQRTRMNEAEAWLPDGVVTK